MIVAIFAAAALLGQAAAAPAADPAAKPAAPSVSGVTVTGKTPEQLKADAAVEEVKIICHNEVVLGTLFPRKVCTTRQQMRDRTRTDQAQVRESQALSPLSGNTPSIAPF